MKEKEIPSYAINIISNGKIGKCKITPEKKPNKWYRKKFDRKKDGLLIPEILQDMTRIAFNLTDVNKKGQRIGKSMGWMQNFPPNPKSSKKAKPDYISSLKADLNNRIQDKQKLAKFIGKKKLVYIAVYLREKRYNAGNDIDNLAKPIIDALKPFMGDDEDITTLILEKKCLPNYPEKDLDFIEQAIVLVTVPEAKKDIFKNVQKGTAHK